MLQFIPVVDDTIIAVRASGKLTHEDYQAFLPHLEARIKTLGKISILFELDHFSGWDLAAVKDDFKFATSHLSDFERIAVVGDKAWEHWMVLMVKPFFVSANIRYFDREKLPSAWDWLREKQRLDTLAEQVDVYKNIVVAVDFSAHAKHAVKRAIALAKHNNASLTLLHITEGVVMFPYYYYSSAGYPYDFNLIDSQNKLQIKRAREHMDDFAHTIDRGVIKGVGNTSFMQHVNFSNNSPTPHSL